MLLSLVRFHFRWKGRVVLGWAMWPWGGRAIRHWQQVGAGYPRIRVKPYNFKTPFFSSLVNFVKVLHISTVYTWHKCFAVDNEMTGPCISPLFFAPLTNTQSLASRTK